MPIRLHGNDRTGVALPAAEMVEHAEIATASTAYEASKASRWRAWHETTDVAAKRADAAKADARLLGDALDEGEC